MDSKKKKIEKIQWLNTKKKTKKNSCVDWKWIKFDTIERAGNIKPRGNKKREKGEKISMRLYSDTI